jgi:hypothetical protein
LGLTGGRSNLTKDGNDENAQQQYLVPSSVRKHGTLDVLKNLLKLDLISG